MNTTAKVSVIIPNYNHSHFLKQRIDSVLNQTFQDFEVIILDDCSTDNSVQVINEYRKHPKVSHIVINDSNSGSTFRQWKKGIDLAAGDWIWIAESDDWCELNFLESLFNGIDEQTGLAFCQSIVVNDKGHKLGQTSWNKIIEKLPGQEFIDNYMMHGNYIANASMCIFKKELSKNINEDYMKYRFIGDWIFWIEIAKQTNVFISSLYLNFFRKHEKDVSGKAYHEGLIYLEAFDFIDDRETNGNKLLRGKKNSLVSGFYNFLNDNRISRSARQEIFAQYRKRIGPRIYFFQFRNFFRKKILNKMLALTRTK